MVMSINKSASTLTAQLAASEAMTRQTVSDLADDLEEELEAVRSTARAADQRALQALNASVCAASGLLYDVGTARCFPRGLGPPDWESDWLPIRSQ